MTKINENIENENIEDVTCHCDEHHDCCCGDECNCDSCDCENDIDQESEEILILKNTIENLEEKVRYHQAELINYRKRKDEEVSNMLKFANQGLIEDLLPILDNFERALNMKSDNKELEKYNEGYKILYSHLVETIKRFGVEEIASLDCEFDPNLHEAVMIGQDTEKEDDIILEVFNKGYILKGRVIRPAKVRVNKI